AALSGRQRMRVRSLARTTVGFDAMRNAAQDAERSERWLVRDVIQSALEDVAKDQQLDPSFVTAAIFAQAADGTLEVVEGLAINLQPPDSELRMRPGETGVGEAFTTGDNILTVFRSPLEESTI